MSNVKLNISKWIHDSFSVFTKLYFNLFFLLLALYALGWGKWAVWAFWENKLLVTFLYFVAIYIYGCLFKRCVVFLKNEKYAESGQYINIKTYIYYFLSELFLSILFIIGMMFFIVPGFIFAVKFSMARLIVIDQNKNPFIALTESFKITTGSALPLSVIVIPVFVMWIIGRFTVHSLSGVLTGNINILSVVFSSCLGLIVTFFILPLTCIALSRAYIILSE